MDILTVSITGIINRVFLYQGVKCPHVEVSVPKENQTLSKKEANCNR